VKHPERSAPIALAAAALAVALYASFLLPRLGRPFVYDDVNFIQGAEAIARTGLPYGNQGYLLHLWQQREQWSLWHPPLYLYTLGAMVAIFGTGEVAARLVAVVCQLVAATITFDLARRMMSDGDPDSCTGFAGAMAVALFLLNPLAIQSALVLDIDNTVLMLLITTFVWLAMRRPGRWSGRSVLAFAVLYAVCLWAKLTTPLALAAALVFTRLFQRTGWPGALQAVLVGALGWAIFLVTWTGISHLTGMPIDYTLHVVYYEAIESGASSRDRFESWAAFVDGVAPAILWIGPFFCLLFFAAGLPALWRLVRWRGLNAGDLVVVLGAAIYLAYAVKLAGAFPKYHAAMLPLWAAAGGALVARTAGRGSWGQTAVILAGGIASGLWLRGPMAEYWELHFTEEIMRFLVVTPLVVGLAVAALWSQIGRSNPIRAVPIALAVLTLSWSIALDAHHQTWNGSTTYFYGRYGLMQAAQALSERLNPDEVYVASKDVAWYATGRHYVDQDSWQHVVWDLGYGFDGSWLGQPVRLLALEVGDPFVRRAYEGTLNGPYRQIGEYGNFVLWERVDED
jgi:4-amino-4-deoxy-L-arabinose transferase-like glycosyltransferase